MPFILFNDRNTLSVFTFIQEPGEIRVAPGELSHIMSSDSDEVAGKSAGEEAELLPGIQVAPFFFITAGTIKKLTGSSFY